MELSPYVESLRADLEAAAAAGDDATRETARRLGTALDASVRLALLDALSALAAEVTDATDLVQVDIRMHGREPQVVVTPAEAMPVEAPPPPATDDDDDRGTARITLRLPEALKEQAEERAGAEGLSVNAWLVRAVAVSVRGPGPGPGGPPFRGGPFGHGHLDLHGRRITGFARS